MLSEFDKKKVEEERENRKFATLASGLGLVAVLASLAIPHHNRQLKNFQESVEAAGTFLVLKGFIQAAESTNQLDKIYASDDENEEEGL